MIGRQELSAAICVYLKNYPDSNAFQFDEVFGDPC
jgi:hypothetical protein